MSLRAAVVGIVLACTAGRPLFAQDSTRAAPPGGRVAGRVIDRDTGRPLVGARIQLIGPATLPP